MHRKQFLLFVSAGALSLAMGQSGCKSPIKQPTLTVARVDPVFTDPKGFVARVHGSAHNPNPFPLPIRRVDAQVTVASQDAAGVQTGSMPTLAPNGDTPVSFDVIVPWPQLSLLASRSGGVDPVPYTVAGKAWIGNDSAEFPFPFEQRGSIKKADILLAALKFVPVNMDRLRRMGEGKP